MSCFILAALASGALITVSPMFVGSILPLQAALSIPSSDLSPHGNFKLTRRKFSNSHFAGIKGVQHPSSDVCFEMGFHSEAQASWEFARDPKMASNSWQSF